MLYLTQKKMKRRSKGKTMNEEIDGNDDDSASSVLLEDYSRMDHLSCFAGGMLALGGSIFGRADHLQYAKELAQTCYQMYVRTPSGLAPEYVQFYHGRDFEVPLAAESFRSKSLGIFGGCGSIRSCFSLLLVASQPAMNRATAPNESRTSPYQSTRALFESGGRPTPSAADSLGAVSHFCY